MEFLLNFHAKSAKVFFNYDKLWTIIKKLFDVDNCMFYIVQSKNIID